MKAALIVMTILGCDDSATQCHYIASVDKSWQTVALCDAQAEAQINRHQNSNYPVIVAVCESAGSTMAAEAETVTPEDAPAAGEIPAVAEPAEAHRGFATRALDFVKGALPDTGKLKAAVSKPVHSIEDGYAWVVRRFAD